jgi:RNA polymerase sigma-70 factor (ECF subfamily)
MTDEHSADLLARWRNGDQQAATELFQRYADRLIALARSRMPDKLGQRVDAEDVVQSVYRSFFAGARAGRYELQRGGDLWRLLVTITHHKLSHQREQHSRKKRAIQRERTLTGADNQVTVDPPLLAREPSPLEVVALVDEVEEIMRGLKPQQRRMLELRLLGYNVFEIAAETQSGERTVRRFLEHLRQQLEDKHFGNADV